MINELPLCIRCTREYVYIYTVRYGTRTVEAYRYGYPYELWDFFIFISRVSDRPQCDVRDRRTVDLNFLRLPPVGPVSLFLIRSPHVFTIDDVPITYPYMYARTYFNLRTNSSFKKGESILSGNSNWSVIRYR